MNPRGCLEFLERQVFLPHFNSGTHMAQNFEPRPYFLKLKFDKTDSRLFSQEPIIRSGLIFEKKKCLLIIFKYQSFGFMTTKGVREL